jgi:hypothetical protein
MGADGGAAAADTCDTVAWVGGGSWIFVATPSAWSTKPLRQPLQRTALPTSTGRAG